MDCKRIVQETPMNYDEENGKEPLTTPDTEESTRFNPSEANNTEKFRRLDGINKGVSDSFGNTNKAQLSKQERGTQFDIIANHANLPEHLHREGRNIMMEQIDMETLKRPGSSIHLVAFCLIVCLVNTRCDQRNYHPQSDDSDRYLSETRKEFEFDIGLIHSYLQKIPNEVEL